MPAIELAHVADVLEDYFSYTDYDLAADSAASLLARYECIAIMAELYDQGFADRHYLVGAVSWGINQDPDPYAASE
jgi:hypothetical protein